MSQRPIAFLSDYGYRDPFAGVCRSVIASIAPQASVIDLTHGIARQDIRAGAVALADAAPFLPAGGVLLAVVDPGVGGTRRGVAAETTDGVALVGPDNGLLWLAAERLGGIAQLVDLEQSPARRETTASTFHGRDLFAPVAAHLSLGEALGTLGAGLASGEMRPLDLPAARVGDGRIDTAVLDIDHYGNVRLCTEAAVLSEIGATEGTAVEVEAGGTRMPATVASVFGDVSRGELLVYADASGALAIAVNRGDAAADLSVHRNSQVTVIRT